MDPEHFRISSYNTLEDCVNGNPFVSEASHPEIGQCVRLKKEYYYVPPALEENTLPTDMIGNIFLMFLKVLVNLIFF
jgi:hypothetical protein